ncbi:MAG TPA: cobalamin biosynthesis protein [Polyangiaceae bacterium]|nr:cobalamin biosynthesis protein [Polyangiaceae bacterium]
MIAAGFGCGKGCSMQDVLDALALSLRGPGLSFDQVEAFFTLEFKAGEEGLGRAARHLARPLLTLSLEQLAAHSQAALTHSAVVLARWGVPSIAETAALAGAARAAPGTPAARLLGARQSAGRASCALATRLGADVESHGLAHRKDRTP